MRLFKASIKIENSTSLQYTLFSTHFDAKMRIILQFFYQKLQNVEHHNIWYHYTLQGFGLSKTVCECTSMGQSRRICSTAPLFFHIFIEKSVCHDCVWYDKDLEGIYQKMKNFDLGSYFCLFIPQRASFSHDETRMCPVQKYKYMQCLCDTWCCVHRKSQHMQEIILADTFKIFSSFNHISAIGYSIPYTMKLNCIHKPKYYIETIIGSTNTDGFISSLWTMRQESADKMGAVKG